MKCIFYLRVGPSFVFTAVVLAGFEALTRALEALQPLPRLGVPAGEWRPLKVGPWRTIASPYKAKPGFIRCSRGPQRAHFEGSPLPSRDPQPGGGP